MNQRIQQTEGINLGFQIILEERSEGTHLGVHNHNVCRDAGIAERNTLVSNGNSQIIHPVVLQNLGDLNGSRTIGVGLNHTHHFCLGFQERAIVVQILLYSAEVYL